MFGSRRRGRRLPPKLRATIGGVILALAALYALAVSYDIPSRELSVYLLGSLALLLGTALAAIGLVVIVKLIRRLLGGIAALLRRKRD